MDVPSLVIYYAIVEKFNGWHHSVGAVQFHMTLSRNTFGRTVVYSGNQRESMEGVVTYLSQTDAPENRPCESIDASELPPPRPLRNTLEQLSDIDDTVVLVQINDRRPQHLYPKLDDRGYEYETLESGEDVITVIWKD